MTGSQFRPAECVPVARTGKSDPVISLYGDKRLLGQQDQVFPQTIKADGGFTSGMNAGVERESLDPVIL